MYYEKQKQAEALANEALRIISELVGVFARADAEFENLKKSPITIFYIFSEKTKATLGRYHLPRKPLRESSVRQSTPRRKMKNLIVN